MKIGIDVRPLQEGHRFRGIGVYLSNLLQALSKLDSHNQYTFYQWPGINVATKLKLAPRFNYTTKHLEQPSKRMTLRRTKNQLSRTIQLRPGELDVFLAPDPAYGLPSGPTQKVSIFYDLVPLLYKNQYFPKLSLARTMKQPLRKYILSKIDWRLYNWQLRQLTKADHIIAISRASQQDLLRLFPKLKKSHVSVVHLAANQLPPPSSSGETLASFNISSPFLLYVGGADYRKNVADLISVFSQLASHQPLQLVLVGYDFATLDSLAAFPDAYQAYVNSPAKNRIVRIKYLEKKHLARLYRQALALVFPSRYEGFGITLLEAMANGCLVVAYKNSSIPEIVGEAAVLVADSQELQPALEAVVSAPSGFNKVRQLGLKQSQRFSWEQTAKKTLAILEELNQ